MGSCYRAGYQSGPWFELKALRQHLDAREARGEDCTWYRGVYESWLTFPEYARADKENIAKGFYKPLASVTVNGEAVTTVCTQENIPATDRVTPELPFIEVVMKHPGGRPRKSGDISRATAWRRHKEQAALL